MRHQKFIAADSFDTVDIAAAWPTTTITSPIPVPETVEAKSPEFVATPAAPDVPSSVGVMIAGSYFVLLGAFALATVGSALSIFVIAICAFFMATFFTVPGLFFGQERSEMRRPDFDRFLAEGMNILTGHCSGRSALVQMLVVPVSLTFGVLAMAVAAAVYM